MIEIAVTTCVLSVAFLMYSGSVVSLSKQRVSTHQNAIAADAARDAIERMRSADFRSIYALYNVSDFDDPDGLGTAPGHRFIVEGLEPLATALDDCAGEIHLPGVEVTARAWQLREDQQLPELGLPRDLDGDSIIDESDHAFDYIHLPVRVTLEWKGSFGPRRLEFTTTLVEYRR